MARAKFYLKNIKLPIGPISIESVEPEYGGFIPLRGKPIYFTNQWSNTGVLMNMTETATWDFVPSGSSIYNTLKSFVRNEKVAFSGYFGAYAQSGLKYNIEIVDFSMSHIEGLVLKGNKTAYSFTLKWNRTL